MYNETNSTTHYSPLSISACKKIESYIEKPSQLRLLNKYLLEIILDSPQSSY